MKEIDKNSRSLPIYAICIILLCMSCVYAPYDRKEYRCLKTDSIAPHNAISNIKNPEFSQYVIENVIIKPFVISTQLGDSKSGKPYYMHFETFADPKSKNVISINKIIISGNDNKVYNPLRSEILPIEIHQKQANIVFSEAEYRFKGEMPFDFENNEKIEVKVTFQINDKSKAMDFMFEPKRYKGLFQLVD